MAPPLQIYNRRERVLVRLADLALAPLAWGRRSTAAGTVTRVLLLRLERIGDLLMTLEAVADVRRKWPHAVLDIAVGSWNAELARMIPGISTVHQTDLPWLSRSERPTSWSAILASATAWRRYGYDLVINFEPDIRTNFLAWRTGAATRAGYSTGGGGAFLTTAEVYDPTSHVSTNARRLVATVTGTATEATSSPRLHLDPSAMTTGDIIVGPRPWIGVHASGGRESKQWHLDRFATVARTLASATGGTIVLTGGPGDHPIVERVAKQLDGVRVLLATRTTHLPSLANLLATLDVFITSDTGPMHLAGAVGTPVVALFGPSDPARYGPRAPVERIVRVSLPCSPCGQVRLPPERCRGHVPDCMDGITADAVVQQAMELMASAQGRRRATGDR